MSDIKVRVSVTYPDGGTVEVVQPVRDVADYGAGTVEPGTTEIAKVIGEAAAAVARALSANVYADSTLKALREAVR